MAAPVKQQPSDSLPSDDALAHQKTTTSNPEVKKPTPQRPLNFSGDSGVELYDSNDETSLRIQLDGLSVGDTIAEEHSTDTEDDAEEKQCPQCGYALAKPVPYLCSTSKATDHSELQDTGKYSCMEAMVKAVIDEINIVKQKLERTDEELSVVKQKSDKELGDLKVQFEQMKVALLSPENPEPTPTPEQTNVHSISAMDSMRPRAATESEYYRRRRPPKLKELPKSCSAVERENPMVKELADCGCISLKILLQRCSSDDLTEVELTLISNLVDPDVLLQLSVRLHGDVKVYEDITYRLRHDTTANKAFQILKKWYDMQHPESCCRQQLVSTFFELGKMRAANSIACIHYTVPS